MTAAIYCRLSKEDEDKKQESESIQNQRMLLTEYAQQKGWEIFDYYVDEDYSGVDRDRPAFRRLLDQAKEKQFDIVLCKTQSRFTRDLELVEKYIHHYFPLWGVRFVAVVDQIDTAVKGNKKARQINGLINEWYLEDLSENVRTVLDQKRRAGRYIGSFALYGYRKSPDDKNQLVIDEEAADVVRRIYGLCLSGYGKRQIASVLNEQGVASPAEYKRGKGLRYKGANSLFEGWNKTSVGRILRNSMYTGEMVQGTRKKASFKTPELVSVPKKDWIVVPSTHEAIIEREVFDSVQALLDSRTRSTGAGRRHPLAGKVRCMDCGGAMVKYSHRYKGNTRSYLRCSRYTQDKNRCSSHSIRLDQLESVLYQKLLQEVFSKVQWVRLMENADEKKGRRFQWEQMLAGLIHNINKRERAIHDLYLDQADGLVSRERFHSLMDQFGEELRELEAQKEEMVRKREGMADTGDWAYGSPVRKLPDGLDAAMVSCFIHHIAIGQREQDRTQRIHIHWLS